MQLGRVRRSPHFPPPVSREGKRARRESGPAAWWAPLRPVLKTSGKTGCSLSMDSGVPSPSPRSLETRNSRELAADPAAEDPFSLPTPLYEAASAAHFLRGIFTSTVRPCAKCGLLGAPVQHSYFSLRESRLPHPFSVYRLQIALNVCSPSH